MSVTLRQKYKSTVVNPERADEFKKAWRMLQLRRALAIVLVVLGYAIVIADVLKVHVGVGVFINTFGILPVIAIFSVTAIWAACAAVFCGRAEEKFDERVADAGIAYWAGWLDEFAAPENATPQQRWEALHVLDGLYEQVDQLRELSWVSTQKTADANLKMQEALDRVIEMKAKADELLNPQPVAVAQ